MRRFLRRPAGRWWAALGTVLQFLGWSVGLTGLFAASTACPCCGQVDCPLGVGAMGIMGALTTAIVSRIHRRRHQQDQEPQLVTLTLLNRCGPECQSNSTMRLPP